MTSIEYSTLGGQRRPGGLFRQLNTKAKIGIALALLLILILAIAIPSSESSKSMPTNAASASVDGLTKQNLTNHNVASVTSSPSPSSTLAANSSEVAAVKPGGNFLEEEAKTSATGHGSASATATATTTFEDYAEEYTEEYIEETETATLTDSASEATQTGDFSEDLYEDETLFDSEEPMATLSYTIPEPTEVLDDVYADQDIQYLKDEEEVHTTSESEATVTPTAEDDGISVTPSSTEEPAFSIATASPDAPADFKEEEEEEEEEEFVSDDVVVTHEAPVPGEPVILTDAEGHQYQDVASANYTSESEELFGDGEGILYKIVGTETVTPQETGAHDFEIGKPIPGDEEFIDEEFFPTITPAAVVEAVTPTATITATDVATSTATNVATAMVTDGAEEEEYLEEETLEPESEQVEDEFSEDGEY